MEWQEPFKKAVAYFKRSKYGECLRLLNYALENGGRDQYAIYDSRAAVHEKTLRLREALLDVKEAIRLAPNRWQCYSRAARLFLLIRKFEEASKMVDIALQKIDPSDDKNRATLVALQSQVIESRKRLSCHVGMLPVELLSSIFQYMVEEEPVLVIKISRVCRHWRTVALGDAALWSTLVLSKKDPNRKSKCWIQRSRGRIRELCLRRTLSDKVDWSLEKLGGIQWDYIRTCQLEDIDILKQLEKAGALHVISQLETLVIRDKLMDSREEFVSYLSDNLRHLTIDGALHVWLSDLQVHSLVSLETIRLGERFIGDLFQLLTKNLSLQSLVVNSPFSAFSEYPEAAITLAHLTVLDYCSGSTQLFKFLRLPSLQVISIQTCVQTKNVIQCLLDSGTSQLKSITFDSCAHLPASELIRILSTNPFVASLTLKKFGGGTVTPILDMLGSSEQLCPALTHLDLSSSSEISSHLLVQIVSSRITAVVESLLNQNEETGRPRVEKIHSLIVDGCTGIDSDTIPWFCERVPHFSYVTRQWNGRR
ncbi:f-box domain protein [Lentinula edodes]|uniref:F-box domain protein n=1 Tax=Lentinula edodes TaxID=5353 RepID=A0A1Q3DYS1_LENED|nr:uncharacterized protein C8R40DRAFT_883842 [Lentinula edodes]KAH7878069.1 hypothetical protein C8R40DRAFT_883842 [Lentinula edodes]GAV99898.1 f-box domain protein [Lentinula edodes]